MCFVAFTIFVFVLVDVELLVYFIILSEYFLMLPVAQYAFRCLSLPFISVFFFQISLISLHYDQFVLHVPFICVNHLNMDQKPLE